MKNFFILGNNPSLSIAEISAVFPKNNSGELLPQNVFLLDEDFDSHKTIKRLGGTIKLGEITGESKGYNPKKIQVEILKMLSTRLPKEGKFKFGISYYGKKKINMKPLGMEIKNFLKNEGVSCRWVISKEKQLSSVVVEQNKLINKGMEIVLIDKGGDILIGYTRAVQLFKELSFRDFNRPARDDKSGMIPPKLAQIMLNLSGKINNTATILDPFCGSGTMVMEALLMKAGKVIGSDISDRAISDSRENTNWVASKYELEDKNYRFFNVSSTDISKKIEKNSIDAIVTEPYLGPQRGWHDVKKTIKELELLYSKSIAEFKNVLKDDGVIVMIWPQFQNRDDTNKSLWKFMNPNISGFKIINPIPKHLTDNKQIKLSSKNTITYGREGQKIFREIVILKKIIKLLQNIQTIKKLKFKKLQFFILSIFITIKTI